MPKPRVYASMVTINDKLYLFGGESSGISLNDVWSFDLINFKWTQIITQGSLPSGRYQHAAGACGDIFVVWGGQDGSQYMNDFFIFNTITSTWTQLFPASNTKPASAAGSCLVVKGNNVYLFGGKNQIRISNELWYYNFGTNMFTLINDRLEYGSYSSYCWLQKNSFYVSLGSFAGSEPNTSIKYFDLNLNTWNVYHSHVLSKYDPSGSVQFFTGQHLISIGGQAWDTLTTDKVIILGPLSQATFLTQKLEDHLYGASSSYFNKSIFIFGGGRTYGRFLIPIFSHNQLTKINLQDICTKSKCEAPCSPGTIIKSKKCEICPAGSYSEEPNLSKCETCRPGTFNSNNGSSSQSQCLPCPQGTYNSEYGASKCIECPKGKYCAVGSKNFVDNELDHVNKSEQPSLYKEPDLNKTIIIYQTLVSVPLFFILVLFMVVGRLRRKIYIFDMYDDKHDSDNEFMIKKKTMIGACFSFLFVIGSLLITCTTVISYFKANIYESKALVPLVVLEKEIDSFISESLSIEFTLYSYGGDCESVCSEYIQVTLKNLDAEKSGKKCKSDAFSCTIKITLNKAVISTGAILSLTLNNSLSYASGIQVNITSSSSIPNQQSSVLTSIKSLLNSVFIGSDPTEFYFLATPSLFTSESKEWNEKETGYHISEQKSPKHGSQSKTEELPTVSYLNLNVFIDKSSTGLMTQRILKQDLLFFAGGLLGTVSGLFGIAGFFMALFEKHFRKIREKIDTKKHIDDNEASFNEKNTTKVISLA